jgi:hypothetical protein
MVSFTPDYIQHLKQSYLGAPNYTCKYCDAMFWYDERNKTDSIKNKRILYSNCCKYGEIKIPRYNEPPQFLSMLIHHRENNLSNHFYQKIRQYNSIFAFTSMGANIDKTINKGDSPYVFRINGQIHHRIGSLLPETDNTKPKFAELYILTHKMKSKIESKQ